MTQALSVYLDLVRFAAAFAVLMSHLSYERFGGDAMPWYLIQFGDVAVASFFVLSGFVIAHVVSTRERDWRSYTSSRLSRLYSVVLVAIALTLLLDTWGAQLNPEMYGGKRIFWKPPSMTGYVASTLLVNEWHVFDWGGLVPGSNGAWWSLSFEATYYLVAGLMLFARPVVWVPLSIALLAMSGVTITALFPLWGLGYALYMVTRQVRSPVWLGLALLGVGAGLLLIYPYVAWRIPRLPFSFEFGRGNFQRHVLADYYSAAAFAVHIAGARLLLTSSLAVPGTLVRLSRWVGAMTFPLYLIHAPMLVFFAAVVPLPEGGGIRAVAIGACVFVAIAALTPLCDRLKLQLRSLGWRPRTKAAA